MNKSSYITFNICIEKTDGEQHKGFVEMNSPGLPLEKDNEETCRKNLNREIRNGFQESTAFSFRYISQNGNEVFTTLPFSNIKEVNIWSDNE